MSENVLDINGATSGYGEITVLKGLDFGVGHEIFAVLGANGAGKTTLMKTLARVLPLTGGELRFQGADVSDETPYALAARGLAFVPQEENVFPDLTVAENLSIGSLVSSRSRQEQLDELFELFPDLAARIGQKAGTLSGGESQMVAVGRALMQDPDLILLDEPTAGLAPKYVDNLFARIQEIHEKRDVSIMLAEQNAAKTLAIADTVMVLSLGEIFLIDATENVDMEALKEGYKL
jgi:branched-chain amino acid transport system ATP-binding protein